MLVTADLWREEIGNFNNFIASNLLLRTYLFSNVYKILLSVFYFLFVVIVCVLFPKCLNTQLKIFTATPTQKTSFGIS